LIEGESARILRRRGPLRITGRITVSSTPTRGSTFEHDDGTACCCPRTRTAPRDGSERRSNDAAASKSRSSSPTRSVGVARRCHRRGDRFGRREPVLDLRGTNDATGRVLEVTEVAIADEIASAANLVLGKAEATPFAILRGLDDAYFGDGSIKEDALRRLNEDLFR